jgi:multisubunit Na+/H+ antiporter MnhB subunit
MKFRIRSLMIDIAVVSILLTVWHLAPDARFGMLMGMGGIYAIIVPFRIYSRKHPGPWSEKAHRGYLAYSAIVLGVMWTIFWAFPGLFDVFAAWPG